MITLTIHDIGRADDPDATTSTEHATVGEALASLHQRFGTDRVRGDTNGGTIGSLTGRVFQASKTWVVR